MKLRVITSFLHRILQKWLKNFESQYETMILRMPWSFITSLKYKSAILDASSKVALQRIKCVTLQKRSTTAMIQSLFLCILGNPTTKSMLISSQRQVRIGKVMYKSKFFLWLCAIWHFLHCCTCLTLLHMPHKISLHLKPIKSLLHKRISFPLPYDYKMIYCFIEQLGMHKQSFLNSYPSCSKK